jgi:hypothetical protein
VHADAVRLHVVNLVTRGSIEHQMLGTLAAKRELADAVIDGRGELSGLERVSSRETFLRRLKLVMGEKVPPEARGRAKPPVGRAAQARDETPPLQRFKQELLAELSNRVQLIRRGALPDREGDGVLVVVDRHAEQVAGIVRRLYGQAVGDEGGMVEVIDPRTLETIERLASLGIVRLPAQEGADLHRGPGLPRRDRSPEAQRLERARQLAAEAERKARMARVLVRGGFASEALAPLREGVELAMRALAVLCGEQAASEKTEAVAAAVTQGCVVAAGLLEPADVKWVSSLRELSAGEAVAASTAQELIAVGEGLVERAQTAVAGAGLGRPAGRDTQ